MHSDDGDAVSNTTLTASHLLQFHEKHFPNARLPPIFIQREAGTTEQHYDPEDDGLGYYDDGVKRTITDAQIAIFRHTEIQNIIRERRRRREGGLPMNIADKSQQKTSARTSSLTSSPKPEGEDKIVDGQAEKLNQWTKTSETTKTKRNKARKRYRQNKKGRRGNGQNNNGRRSGDYEDSESDEWDPWKQATGPDAQKDTAVELDY